MKSLPLAVANIETATFDCSFGRGCDGICCRNGRPSVTPAEQAVIASVLPRALPLMRPEARAAVECDGVVSARTKLGQPMVRVAGGWCVFFNAGCVLHTIGAQDGESYQYKPRQCALFPLDRNDDRQWYVRQWNYEDEVWALFCLNPANSLHLAAESLAAEMALAAKLDTANDVPSSRFQVEAEKAPHPVGSFDSELGTCNLERSGRPLKCDCPT